MAAVLTASEVANRLHDARGTKGETGDYYYLFTVQTARIGALLIFGRYTQAERELRDVLARAEATANRTAILQVTTMRSMVEQGFDRASESRPRLDREREELPRGIGLLHMTHLIAVLRTACYTFDFDWAFASIEQYWDRCLHSPLRHGTLLRYLLHSSRARMLLNQYVTQGRRGDPGRVIRDDLRALRGIHISRLRDPARNYEARLAYLRGDVPGAARAATATLSELVNVHTLEALFITGATQVSGITPPALSQRGASYSTASARAILDWISHQLQLAEAPARLSGQSLERGQRRHVRELPQAQVTHLTQARKAR
jgi:hypothetical protein